MKGVGIPKAMQAHIFELFFQQEQTIDRSHGGLGLGLPSSTAWSRCTAAG
jgi:signal transduction histidine kinase